MIQEREFSFLKLFNACRYWDGHSPEQFINRVPVNRQCVSAMLGCPFSDQPVYIAPEMGLSVGIDEQAFFDKNNCDPSCRYRRGRREG